MLKVNWFHEALQDLSPDATRVCRSQRIQAAFLHNGVYEFNVLTIGNHVGPEWQPRNNTTCEIGLENAIV